MESSFLEGMNSFLFAVIKACVIALPRPLSDYIIVKFLSNRENVLTRL